MVNVFTLNIKRSSSMDQQPPLSPNFPQPSYPPNTFPPTGYPPSYAAPPQGYAPNTFPPPGYPQQQFPFPVYPPRRTSRKRKFVTGGIIAAICLILIAGFLIYRASTTLPSSWVADGGENAASSGVSNNAVYYLSWSNQNNYLTGSLAIVDYETDALVHTYLRTDTITEQFTGNYNSQDQTVTLNISSDTFNGQTTLISETDTGHVSGSQLTLSGPAYTLGGSDIVSFHAGNESEYNQDIQGLPNNGNS
jgi:hypothetical protein